MPTETAVSTGLRILEDISTLIIHSHDLQQTLDNIVALIARRMGTDVCSIYLLENDGETLVLKATKGLSRSAVGKVRMNTSEGLTGLVVEQRRVVALEDAPSHPRYKYFRETREERFHSFLGLPIMEHKSPAGVLIVQTREPRSFTKEEISTLTTIVVQISNIIVNARLLDSIRKKEEKMAFFERELERLKTGDLEEAPGAVTEAKKERQPLMIIGTAVSPGFSWGKVYIIKRDKRENLLELEKTGSPREESRRFQVALEKARIETIYLEKRVAESISGEDASIFHTHLMILEDRGFISKVQDLIDGGHGAGRAVNEVVSHYVNAFSRMEDPYLRERSADMEDIGRRIIGCLSGNKQAGATLREKRVIVAEDILPSDLATLDHEKILGIVTATGDATSHAAIMARSLGIPAVFGEKELTKKIAPRDYVIIDGNTGCVFVNPDAKVREEYERLNRDHHAKKRELDELRDVPAVTLDGTKVFLRANIGLLSDVRIATANGAEGVGLYRTEFPYMARNSFPTRKEQYRLYKKIIEGFGGLPVTIRTLDIGGDKGLPYFPCPKEDNPFMGWRSIRLSLEREDIFREQLAAVLLASAHGSAKIMFPMVSSVEEIRTIRKILDEIRLALKKEGHPIAPSIPLGIMIELPAAVQTAHLLIREVDFFSIGTNDLIQYTMAADRNNPKVKKYYDPYHPAVLHSIRRVAEVALQAGKKVSVCGEMASDPVNAVLLLGLGISDFSLAAPYIPAVKQAVRKITMARAEEIAVRVLAMENSTDIKNYLQEVKRELGL
ncbi:MAG TPA: phosphoenolpyruvate--protein phosphotransferase [Geobacteraceae bacterium]|nr:phosphoenolpyruvate--protein phosphotransferase [Geobacteraceae bacterium]